MSAYDARSRQAKKALCHRLSQWLSRIERQTSNLQVGGSRPPWD